MNLILKNILSWIGVAGFILALTAVMAQYGPSEIIANILPEQATTTEVVGCACGINEEDILTARDVLDILYDNKSIFQGQKGDIGEKGSKGDTGLAIMSDLKSQWN